MVLSHFKCPQCGLMSFKEEIREIELKGKNDSDDYTVTAITCKPCGYVSLYSQSKDKFKGIKVPKKFTLTK